MAQAVSARYYDGSSASLSSNETKLLNAYSYNGSNASAHHQELVECYKKMKSEMVSHYDVPNGTSKNKNIIGKAQHILQNMMSRQASGQQSSSLTAFHSSAFQSRTQ